MNQAERGIPLPEVLPATGHAQGSVRVVLGYFDRGASQQGELARRVAQTLGGSGILGIPPGRHGPPGSLSPPPWGVGALRLGALRRTSPVPEKVWGCFTGELAEAPGARQLPLAGSSLGSSAAVRTELTDMLNSVKIQLFKDEGRLPFLAACLVRLLTFCTEESRDESQCGEASVFTVCPWICLIIPGRGGLWLSRVCQPVHL